MTFQVFTRRIGRSDPDPLRPAGSSQGPGINRCAAALLRGANSDHAPSNTIIATHGAAARQKARAHSAQSSTAGCAARRAMMRFSKAYGTRVARRIGSCGGDQLSFQLGKIHTACIVSDALLARAVTDTSLWRFVDKNRRISARARKARTLTSGPDQPVIAEISFTDRSSISSNVMISRAAGKAAPACARPTGRAASAFSLAASGWLTNRSSQSSSGSVSSAKVVSRLRWWPRRKSMQMRTARRMSQCSNGASPRKLLSFSNALSQISWAMSSTSLSRRA